MKTDPNSAEIIRQPNITSLEADATMTTPCVLLMSGGVESSMLFFESAQSKQIVPIFLDYGQRAAAQEWRTVQNLTMGAEITAQRYDLSTFGNAVGALRAERYHVPLPHRNFVAIAAVAAIASNLKINVIRIGLSADDAQVDNCSRPAFQNAIGQTLNSLGLQLDTPLIHMSKTAIIEHGNRLNVPWQRTYSCLLGRSRHCGFCPQCQKRRTAFAEAGASDQDVGYNLKP